MNIEKHFLRFGCLSALMIMLSSVNIYAAVNGTVKGDNVNVRSQNSLTSDVVTKLKSGEKVTILEDLGEFYKVNVKNNNNVYIAKQFISLSGSTGFVKDKNVNVRKGASKSAQVLGKVNSGDIFAVTGVDGEWYTVSYNGQTAYINKDFIKCDNPPKAQPKQVAAATPAPVPTPAPVATPAPVQTPAPAPVTVAALPPDVPTPEVKPASLQPVDVPAETVKLTSNVVENSQPPVKTETDANLITDAFMEFPQNEEEILADIEGEAPEGVIDDESYVNNTPVSMYTVVIARSGLNFRTGPSLDATVNEIIPYGTVIDVTETGSEWVKINYGGKEGYVNSEFILVYSGDKPINADIPQIASSNNEKASQIVDYAMKFIGTPYKFGSANLSKGVDCSGFVTAVMLKFGVKLPRSSVEMSKVGVPVKKSELQVGDLVFFAPRGTVNHVVIYIGNGKFIHSTDSKGKGVCLGNMNDDYRVRNYHSARRVIQ